MTSPLGATTRVVSLSRLNHAVRQAVLDTLDDTDAPDTARDRIDELSHHIADQTAHYLDLHEEAA